jgi:hypothetical protein
MKMLNTNTHTRRPLILASALIAIVTCLALAACGGSSSKSATSANAANTSSTSTRGAAGDRFAAMRECLQKNGITLPQRPTGQRRAPGAGGLLGGGGAGAPQLPKGVTRAQFQAAIQKCGGSAGRFVGPGGQGSRRRFGSPAFRTALTAFVACMNSQGIKLPAPNTSGKGPIFNTQGINTTSASFKAASTKCQSVLRNAFPRRPRAGQSQQ